MTDLHVLLVNLRLLLEEAEASLGVDGAPDADGDPLWTRAQASKYLLSRYGIGSTASLATWAVRGEGPEHSKNGPKLVVYRRSALDRWAQARLHAPGRRGPKPKAVAFGSRSARPRGRPKRLAAASLTGQS